MEDLGNFNLKVVTPSGTALERSVEFCKVMSESGEVGVLPNHSPTLAKIVPGEILITKGEDSERYFVRDGFLRVSDNETILITPFLENIKDIDVERAEEAQKKAIARIKAADKGTDTSIDKPRATASLMRAEARLFLYHQQIAN